MPTNKKKARTTDKAYARLHYCGHSPDPAHYWWGITCPAGTLDFDHNDKSTAQSVTAMLNAAYQQGKADAAMRSERKGKK